MATTYMQMASDFATPKLRGPGEGKTLNVLGDQVTIKVSSAESGGTCAVIEDVCPPQSGPPQHIHKWEDEAFYILEGEYELRMGDQLLRAGKGAFAFLPRGIAHTFKNVGTTPGRHLVTIMPGGFERFFERIDQISQAGPPDFEKVLALADSFGLIFVGPKDQRAGGRPPHSSMISRNARVHPVPHPAVVPGRRAFGRRSEEAAREDRLPDEGRRSGLRSRGAHPS